MFSKKAEVISTAAGAGAKSATKEIQNALFYWGVPYIKEYGVAVQAMCWEQVSDKKKERIKQDIEKLANKIANNPNPLAGIKTKFMFGIMRMVQIKGMGSSPEETEYWKINGWLDKNAHGINEDKLCQKRNLFYALFAEIKQDYRYGQIQS